MPGQAYVRLAANAFQAWCHIPGDGYETRFSVYLHAIENRETDHYLNATGGPVGVVKKDTLLQINELASMSLSLLEMKALKGAIDGALMAYEDHERRKGRL